MDRSELERLRDARRRWEQGPLRDALARQGERAERFSTVSDLEIGRLYGPEDLASQDPARDLGQPGEYPFTRGIHATMYRGRLWTMRMFAGFGAAEDTNARFRYLLAQGQTGLSVAFDMPTLMGRDSDDPRSLGEVGHCGVAIDSAADMAELFDGIPLDETTTSMTISGPAVPVFCMYLVAAERQGKDIGKLDGTLQTDIFKEYTARRSGCSLPSRTCA